MKQTEAQRRYGQRRTLANRLDRYGEPRAAYAIRYGIVPIPKDSNGKENNK